MKTFLLVTLVAALLLFGCTGGNSASKANEPFNAEVRFQFNGNLMTATITNRNTYNWTNLQVIADDYYPCKLNTGTTLAPNDQTYVVICSDTKNPPLTVFSKLDVKTDQGEQVYVR